MSWGCYVVGKASSVRRQAKEQLGQAAKNCASISSEVASIEGLATAVDAICDQSEGQVVRVNASGSAWLENGKLKSYQYEAKVEVLDASEE